MIMVKARKAVFSAAKISFSVLLTAAALSMALPAAAANLEHCRLAEADFAAGRYQASVQAYTVCIETGGLGKRNLPVAHNNRGVSRAALGDHRAAVEDYDRAIAYRIAYLEAYNNRGVSLYHLGAYHQAVGNFDAVLALDADYARAYANRGAAHYRMRAYDAALADYHEAVMRDDGDAGAFFGRAMVYEAVNATWFAILNYEQVLRLQPEHVVARARRCQAYQAMGPDVARPADCPAPVPQDLLADTR